MRELLDAAIGVAPPTRIDVEATIARQRRLLMLRPAGAAVLVLAVVAAVAVAGGHPGRPSGVVSIASVPVSPSPSRSVEPLDQILRRQSAAINELLLANLHGETIADRRTRNAPIEVIPSKDYPGYGAGDANMAEVVISSPAGIGDFGLFVDPRPGTGATPRPSETAPQPGSCDDVLANAKDVGQPQCAESTGPDGETVLAVSARIDSIIMFRVLVWRPDSLVIVAVRNCWNGWDGNAAPTKFLPRPPLTLDQLKTIAVDPRLAM